MSAVGTEARLDVLGAAVRANPAGIRGGFLRAAIWAEGGGDVLRSTIRTGPARRDLLFLKAAIRAEAAGDVLVTALRAVPGIRCGPGLRLLRAAVGAEAGCDILMPAFRAVPGITHRSHRYSRCDRLLGLEALHHISDLRRDGLSCRHADAETQHVPQDAAAAATGGNGGTHVADALSISLLHVRLKHILLVVALGSHDLRLREARHTLGLGLRLGGDDLPLRFPACDLRLCGLLLQHDAAAGGLDGGLRLLLRRAVLRLCLGLGGLHRGLRLDGAGLEGDGMQLPDALEIGVVLRQHDVRHVELGDGEAVFLKAGQQLLPQASGNLLQMLVDLQQIDGLLLDDGGEVCLYRAGDEGPEGGLEALGLALATVPGDPPQGAHQLQQQAAGIGDLEVHFAGGPQPQRHAGERVDEAHLLRGAPLHRHLNDLVDVIDFAVEGALGVRGELVELLQQGELLGLQGIAPRAEEVQGLAVPEEDGLLALMDDELASIVEVLDGVLPDEGVPVPLIFDDAGEAVRSDLLAQQALRHVVFTVANGAGICTGALGHPQADATLTAGELRRFVLLSAGVDGLMADGALGCRPLGLVENHGVAAVGALAATELVRAHVDDVAAGTVDLLPGKEPGLGFRVPPAYGAFDYESGHGLILLHSSGTFGISCFSVFFCCVGDRTLYFIVDLH